MIAEEQQRREKAFRSVTVWFCILYYLVAGLNIYIAILQLFNLHYFYFAYFAGLFTLEKMALLLLLRRLGLEQAEQLVLNDALMLGWVFLKGRKDIQDICTFFISKLYLSVIPTVYLQLWFYFGFELIEKDYIQFGWWRPAIMDFTIIANVSVLGFCLCLYKLTVESQPEEMASSLHKLRVFSLLMSPFGYQMCLYSLLTIQIQAEDKFGICIVFYGITYQILIEASKKFLNFSLNINEFGILNLIRRVGPLAAIQAEKQLSLPDYVKSGLNFSGLIDLSVHVIFSLFVAHVSLLSDHKSREYESFASKFLIYQNMGIYSMVALFVLLKTFYAAYVSRSIWIDHSGKLTSQDIIKHILQSPDIWFVIIFHLASKDDEEIELKNYRPSQDLLAYMDEDELSVEDTKKLANQKQQTLLKDSESSPHDLSMRMTVRLLARLVRIQHYKGFIDVQKTISVSKNCFYLNIKHLHISEQVIECFLSQIPTFPAGIKIELLPTTKFTILADRFLRFGFLSDTIINSLDCSRQVQRMAKSLNSTMCSLFVFHFAFSSLYPRNILAMLLLELQEPLIPVSNKCSTENTPLLHHLASKFH